MQFTRSRAHKKALLIVRRAFQYFEEKENAMYLNLSFSGITGVGVDTLPDLSMRQVVKVSQGHIPPPF